VLEGSFFISMMQIEFQLFLFFYSQEIKREITIQLHLLNSKGSRLECIEEKT
jgi:hypothetical protein